MSNSNSKLDNLTPFKPKWKSGKTKLYRLPEAIAPQVLEYAHKIDEGVTVTSDVKAKIFNWLLILDTLERALKLPANKGGAIKAQIRKALELLRQASL